MKSSKGMRNVFADKASIILRKMLCHPGKKWVIRDFTGDEGVSIGMVQGVLETMSRRGYIERVKRGPESYSLLTNEDGVIRDWLQSYRFEQNEVDTYYSPDTAILSKLKKHLKEKEYALTLHAGANLITSFVVADHIYVYLNSANWDKDVLDLRQRLDLKELVRGGNIHIIRPYYKKSVFLNVQTITGYKVVSNLQLYLDLFNFRPRGQEHAEYLKTYLKEIGKNLYEF
ncbi:type IV toxin-antitoxin system AbiEi family antitoxin [Chlamydiota bacterium]